MALLLLMNQLVRCYSLYSDVSPIKAYIGSFLYLGGYYYIATTLCPSPAYVVLTQQLT